MTTVYIAIIGYDWQSGGVDTEGVYSTRELALAGMATRCGDDCSHDVHRIEAWEVDGAVGVEEVWPDQIREAARASRERE